jgi:DNA-binding IclR family transcriptional regulator
VNERLPTNLRTLLILEAIGRSVDPPSPASIGRAVGLPKQTVHRLCNTLLSEGFLAKDEKDGRLRAGRRARDMASGILQSSTAHIARHQILLRLAEAVGETVNFVVPEDQGMSYKDRIETNWAFRIQLPIGSHVPFHCTASGKTFLASLPKAERRRLVNVMKLDPMTKNTISDPESLLAELARVARQGYAIDNEEFMDGMVAIAVPVFDTSGKYAAALAFHGPVQRMSIEDAIARADELRRAARDLETVMFT